MKSRIYGLETEYGLAFFTAGRMNLSIEAILGYLFESIILKHRCTNVFLDNGARLYQDTGCHPEYASPECRDPLDLVKYDKAGERIIEGLLLSAENRLKAEGIRGDLFIFKNNIDSVGNTYGCHENYLVDRKVEFQKIARGLIPFLVTRQVYAGSGRVVRTSGENRFHLSQRAQHICQEISSATTGFRSIINTRDEPHADPEKYRRLHVILGDSNMSEYSTYLKVGTTAIVLRMIEEGFLKKRLNLRDPVTAIQEISQDSTCKRRIRLEDGRAFTAVEIQREYWDQAKEFFNNREGEEWTEDILEKWQYVLNRLEENPLLLRRELDWVIKKNLITSYMLKHSLGWNDQRIFMIDLQYHDVKQERGLYYLLERRGLVGTLVSREKVIEAMHYPPQNTRAKMRSEFIRRALRANRLYDVNWSYLRLNDRYHRTIACPDPFQVFSPEVERLFFSL